jgi:transposase
MSEIDAEVLRRLVTGRKNDGRAVYDPQVKAEVVRACMKPGVSVAGMALQCGINANLLRRWISQSMGADRKQSQVDIPTVARAGADTFVPLRLAVQAVASVALKVRLHARLPNGVEVEISDADPGKLMPVLELLGHLPCSDSTRR